MFTRHEMSVNVVKARTSKWNVVFRTIFAPLRLNNGFAAYPLVKIVIVATEVKPGPLRSFC